MSFNTITIGPSTFNSVGDGRYMESTVGLGQPYNGWRLIPGKKQSGKAPTIAVIQRYVEADFTVSGVTTRRRLSVTVNLSVPDGFVALDVDNLLTDVSTFVTAATVTRLLLGES